MKKLISIGLISLLGSSLSAYDRDLAKKFENFYQNFTQKAIAETDIFVDSEQLYSWLYSKEKLTILDVRTEGETSMVAITHPSAIDIPLSEVFKSENLEKLDKNSRIVVSCKSGSRSLIVALNLKMLGFKKYTL